MVGAITGQIDAAQLLVIVFFVFFAGLIYYLRREDKRDGYPLVDPDPRFAPFEGFPPMPSPKTYRLLDGGTTQMPRREAPSRVAAEQLLRFPGAPLVPVGDPLLSETGPGAYPMRSDLPMLMEGRPSVQPLRVATDWSVAAGDADPRGMVVLDARAVPVGTVGDIWVDRSVKILRYLEVELDAALAADRRVLLPVYYTDINRRRRTARVRTLLAGQFALVPGTADPDRITAREEDRINAFWSGALLFGAGVGGALLQPAAAPRVAGA